MWLVGVVLLTVSNEASRSVIEGAFAHASVLFADNVRILATATVILAAFVALRYMRRVSRVLNNKDMIMGRNEVKNTFDYYADQFADAKAVDKRQNNYMSMVNSYYSLVTDLYTFAWGESFHFAPRFKGETFHESILRAEHYLALQLGLREGQRCLDIGCGVGGPLRNIIKFSGARITGVNNSDYQLKLARRAALKEGVSDNAEFVQSDFMELASTVKQASFDAAYQIEATCHAPDKAACYRQIFDCLKPGARFAGYEWCVTPKFDASNSDHVRIKEGIEKGNSLPDLATFAEVTNALEKAGFRVIAARDANAEVHGEHQVPWYTPLKGGDWSLKGFASTRLGGLCTHVAVTVLEGLGVAPKGTRDISSLLRGTQVDLIDAGRSEVFTPSFFFLAEKPTA